MTVRRHEVSAYLIIISLSDVKPRGVRSSADAAARRHRHAGPPRCAAACACRATSRSRIATRLLAALAEGRSTLTNFAPGADCRSTLACLRALGVEISKTPTAHVTVLGRGVGRSPFARRPARRRQLGHDDAAAGRHPGGQPFASHADRRRLAVAPADAPRDRAARANGRPHRGDRRPCAARRSWRAAARDCLPPDVPSAQVKSAVLLAGLHAEGTTQRRRAGRRRATTPSGRWRPSAVDAAGRRARRCRFSGGQRLRGTALRRAGRLLVGRLLDGRRRGAPRLARRDRGRRTESDADRAARTCCGASARASSSRSTATDAGEPRGTIVVEGDRRGTIEIAPEEVPGLIDELPAIAALAAHGGEVSVRGAGGAARQGKRSHRGARRRLSRARHRRRRAARRIRDRAVRRARLGAPPAASPTRAAITGWRWRLRSPRSAPTVRPRSTARTPWPSLSRLLRHAGPARRVKADKIYLVGFMAAGKTTVARALAKRQPDLRAAAG